ncbi:exo-alpha-sialidase [Nonomuraea sp. K274]|uniref:exo-alpha-sialidase n=1 Tax=Nonomuraea cypriaca TaxID=1187855 RepID=A0A931ADB4_9ACTN|nr:exo-alpha-sialidase [Nonomuraea cypriaca]MBF8187172.1 exo-alpha-sialidase [Nonomuraea cypriaca]
MVTVLMVAALSVSAAPFTAVAARIPGGHVEVFANGEREAGAAAAYVCFRAPTVVKAGDGGLLAFAGAHLETCGDSGPGDIVLKRSSDGGRTWGALRVLARHSATPRVFAHNPVPIVDTTTDPQRVVLLYTENHDRVYVRTSDDHGATWGERKAITRDIWKPAWGAWQPGMEESPGQVGTGPAHGIQLTRGDYAGRLVAGVTVRLAPGIYRESPLGGALIYSDDHGATWQAGASSHGAEPAIGAQELSLFERSDGSVFVVARNEEGTAETVDRAAYAVSRDQGETFEVDFSLLPPLGLPARGVQASALALRAKDRDGYDRALLAAPAGSERVNLTIRSSFDGGRTWQAPQDGALVRDGISAYSDMIDLGGGKYGIIYEGGIDDQHEFVRFATFTEADLDMPDNPTSLTADQYTGALATTTPNQLHLFAPTPDGGLGHWFEEADGTVKRGTWGTAVAGETVAYVAGAQQHALVRGTDGSLRHRFWDAGRGGLIQETWLPSGTVSGAPAAITRPGQQHAFVRTPDGRLLHTWWDSGTNSRREQTWAAAGTLAGDPVAVVFGDQQHVWATGTDGRLHHWWWTKGPGIRHEIWTGTAHGTPAAFVHRGQLHVFAADAQRLLSHWWWDSGTQVVRQQTWDSPVPLGGRPSAFVYGSQQHVFARTTGDTLAHWWWDPAYDEPRHAVWSGALRSDPVTKAAGEAQHVFGASADGGVTHWWWDRTDGVQREDWGGQIASTPRW